MKCDAVQKSYFSQIGLGHAQIQDCNRLHWLSHGDVLDKSLHFGIILYSSDLGGFDYKFALEVKSNK
jgi:hypothetical protein